MPASLSVHLDAFEGVARRLLASLPPRLLREDDLRMALAEAIFTSAPDFYAHVENLQFEKTGDGVATGAPIDLYCVVDGIPHFFEFKHWKTMVKAKSGRREIGKGNATESDYKALLNDFTRLADVRSATAARHLIYLVQVQQYPGSSSKLVPEHAKLCDPENAEALFGDAAPVTRELVISGQRVQIDWERPPVEITSCEGIQFRLFVYRVHPRA